MILWLNEFNSNLIYINIKLVGVFIKECVIIRINDLFYNILGNEKFYYFLF